MLKAERCLLLVDGHAYAYRSFYAIRGMRSPAGEPTGAIFGFIKALEKLWKVVRSAERGMQSVAIEDSAFRIPNSALGVTVVVWDGGLAEERLAVLPGYKAQRPELPAELGTQIGGLVEFLGAAGVASVCVQGVEADDVIAGLALQAAGAGWGVFVGSSDKDFMQLVSEEGEKAEGRRQKADGWIGLLNPNDKSERVWGAAEVLAKTGVSPSQVVDWLALVGDAVDNIPGVPGVGAKTAAMLLGRFGSVDGIYERLEEVESVRLRRALAESAEVVRRNQGLVRLNAVLPEGVSLEGLRGSEPDWSRLAELFRRWGFRGLLAQAERELKVRSAEDEGSGSESAERGAVLERVERQAVLL